MPKIPTCLQQTSDLIAERLAAATADNIDIPAKQPVSIG